MINQENLIKLQKAIILAKGGCAIDWNADTYFIDRMITDAGWDGGLCGPSRIAAFLEIPEADATKLYLMGSMDRIRRFNALSLSEQKILIAMVYGEYAITGVVNWDHAFELVAPENL